MLYAVSRFSSLESLKFLITYKKPAILSDFYVE